MPITVEEIIDKYTPLFAEASGGEVTFRYEGNNIAPNMELRDGRYQVWDSKGPSSIVSFSLHRQINCCGAQVLTDVIVNYEKHGVLLHRFAEDLARHMGYSLLLCTDTNRQHQECLKKAKWTVMCTWRNRRTNHVIYVASKKVSR